MIPERAIRFPVRTVFVVLGIIIGVFALLQVLLVTRQVLTWILVALFLAIALNPAVGWLQDHGIRRRGYAVALTSLGVAGVMGLIGWLVIPQLVDQVNEFAQKVPDYIDDLTKGRGRFGFLETKYHIVERIREAVAEGGASKVFGLSGTAISITKGVLTMVAAVITIIALTYLHAAGRPDVAQPLLLALLDEHRAPPARDLRRHRQGCRRLRDRQPLHQRHRRHHLGRDAAGSWGSSSRSHSACWSRCST